MRKYKNAYKKTAEGFGSAMIFELALWDLLWRKLGMVDQSIQAANSLFSNPETSTRSQGRNMGLCVVDRGCGWTLCKSRFLKLIIGSTPCQSELSRFQDLEHWKFLIL